MQDLNFSFKMESSGLTGNSSRDPSEEKRSISEALRNPTTITISLVLLLLILIILIGNLIIFSTICATKRLRVPTFFFVASLAVADFLVGLFIVPVALVFQVAIQMKDLSIFTDELCYAWVFASIWFSTASTLNLCSISYDRYLAITMPLRYSLRMGKKKVRLLLIFIWVASFFVSVLTWKAVKHSPNRIHQCSTQGMNLEYAIPIFLVLFGIPVVFLVFTNAKVLVIARRQMKKIKAQSNLNLEQLELHNVPTQRLSSLQRKLDSLRMWMEIRIFKLFLIVIGVFVVCWLPFFIFLLITSVKLIKTPDNIKLIFISLTYFNSACNVFIYGFLNKDFRRAVMELKSRMRSRTSSPSSSSGTPGRATLERELGIVNENCDATNSTMSR